MSDPAAEFLAAWSLKREPNGPLSRHDAEQVAERWEQEASDNGIDPADLRAAAGGDIAAYLLRTFGEEGDEFEL